MAPGVSGNACGVLHLQVGLVQLLRTLEHIHRSLACTFTLTCTLTCCTHATYAGRSCSLAHALTSTLSPSLVPLHICMRGAARQVVTEPVGSVLSDWHLAPCACLSSALMLSFSCFGSDGMDHPFNRKVRDWSRCLPLVCAFVTPCSVTPCGVSHHAVSRRAVPHHAVY
jgi:hypothetical protein